MKQFTAQEIQDRLDNLPEELQEAITSADINTKVEDIAKKNGLHFDQMGELADEVGLVMLGLSKSIDFVDNISKKCNINTKSARDIAEEINREVFDSIREYMKNYQKENPENPSGEELEVQQNDNTDLERAGDFQIMREEEEDKESMTAMAKSVPAYEAQKEVPAQTQELVQETEQDPVTTTSDIPANNTGASIPAKEPVKTIGDLYRKTEKPAETRGTNMEIEKKVIETAPPAPEVKKKTVLGTDNEHTDMIADHLLANPVSTKHENIVKTAEDWDKKTNTGGAPSNLPTGDGAENIQFAEAKQTRPAIQRKNYDTDPYREAL